MKEALEIKDFIRKVMDLHSGEPELLDSLETVGSPFGDPCY